MDLSSEIKQFAAENEEEIKQNVLRMLEEFFDSSISSNYEEKWDAGAREHGAMTEDKLRRLSLAKELTSEFQDAFWYTALILFRQHRGQKQD